jgi:serralysin
MGAGADTLTNTGKITGSVTFEGTGDALTNGGDIHGNVTMGTTDTFTNTGTIHGNVVLGTGDIFNSSAGEITGTVTAAASDTFDFSGSFGHNTISGFVATSTSHDVISFSSNDFANYAAVQADMTQVGADVVINLDSGDSIVLLNQTLSHLVSHDFAFI